jgi:hypothetical protein
VALKVVCKNPLPLIRAKPALQRISSDQLAPCMRSLRRISREV